MTAHDTAATLTQDRTYQSFEDAVQIDLSADAEAWVRSEVESGRFASAAAAVSHAIEIAKLSRLRADLAAAEAEGGSLTADEVRRSVGEYAQQRLNPSPAV